MDYSLNYQIEVYDIAEERTLHYDIPQVDIDEFLSALRARCRFSRASIMSEADTSPYFFRIDWGEIVPPYYDDEIDLDEYLKGYGYPYGYR